ncbi:hypothetical protein, partial [Klebsiella pneumoniae]|uniref:hypothetical protein n=1 Tax=Klebsiella pneumoniae TaxID=573 RepID=UPI002245B0FC
GKNSLNRLIRCVCGKKIGPDPRNFNQRVSLGRNDLLIRTFLNTDDIPQALALASATGADVAASAGLGKLNRTQELLQQLQIVQL